jgi:choline-glycine betaine transporter
LVEEGKDMRKLVVAVLLAAAVFAFSQCSLFSTTVEYNISGSSFSLDIMYQDESGTLVEVRAASPWSTSFQLYSSERPFLAFIRVTNNGGSNVDAYILEDGGIAAGPSTATALGGTTEIHAVIY